MHHSHITPPPGSSHYLPVASENEHKVPRIKSPIKSSFMKRRLAPKATYNNENKEPNQPKTPPFPDTNSTTNTSLENKNFTSTSNSSKLDLSPVDAIPVSREHNPPSKPAESPFTAFCKELHLSPGPLPYRSPIFFGKNALLFGSQPLSNDVGNLISPSPLNLQLGPEAGSSSPLFPRKHVAKLDFSNRFVMFKPTRDDISMETEDNNDKYGGPAFENPISYDDNIASSPKFNFPLKKSIYTNTSLIPTQSRSTDIYSQSPLRGDLPPEDQESKEEPRLTPNIPKYHEDEEVEVDIIPVNQIIKETLKTPSPGKRVTLDSINSFPKGENSLAMQKSLSFGAGATGEGNQSSSKSSMKIKQDDEEDEDGEFEEGSNAHGLSNSKKKICCNCKKSRCLKLYCDCFARGKACSKECNCQNCLNNEANAEERRAAMANTLERNPIAFKPKVNLSEIPEEKLETKDSTRARHIKGCNCKKSGCLKKYCECFQAGAKCTDVCKCENCKNLDPATTTKKAQSYGSHSHGLESQENSNVKPESPFSESLENSSKRPFKLIEHEDEESLYEENDDEEVKKYSHPRKQLFSASKASHVSRDPVDKGSKLKGDDNKEHAEDKEDNDKHSKSANKNKGKKKKNANASALPKTPTAVSDAQKKVFEYTQSPEKQSLSGGRTRRNIRPFSHINPDEYELGK